MLISWYALRLTQGSAQSRAGRGGEGEVKGKVERRMGGGDHDGREGRRGEEREGRGEKWGGVGGKKGQKCFV